MSATASKKGGEPASEQTRVLRSQGKGCQGTTIVFREDNPTCATPRGIGRRWNTRSTAPRESPQALGTSSSSDVEGAPVATGFRDHITEQPPPRDRQRDRRAGTFQPSLHRRWSLRMPVLAERGCGPTRRRCPATSLGLPMGQLGESVIARAPFVTAAARRRARGRIEPLGRMDRTRHRHTTPRRP